MMLGKVSHGACSERSPLGSFAQLAHSPRIQPADGHYHSTNYLQRERAKRDGAEQEGLYNVQIEAKYKLAVRCEMKEHSGM